MKKLSVEKSGINGLGLFAEEDIVDGDKIAYIRGKIRVVRDFSKVSPELNQISFNWFGIGRYSYIDSDHTVFRFLNHSCDPNSIITTPRTLRARKRIKAGEEITMDYSLTEAGQDWSIPMCNCKSQRCRRLIEPINKLPLDIYRSYLPNIPKNFQRIYMRFNKINDV